GRAAPGEFGDFVCFSGRGPGEVFFEGHKVVGLSQWRSRQGALFSMCAYQRWDPGPIAALLRPLHEMTKAQVSVLDGAAVGVADLMGRATDLAGLGHALVGSVAGWGA